MGVTAYPLNNSFRYCHQQSNAYEIEQFRPEEPEGCDVGEPNQDTESEPVRDDRAMRD